PQEERPQDWKYVLAVKGCLRRIGEIVWRPNNLEFATADEGGSIRVWRIVEESGRVRVQMMWGSGESALVASGSLLDDAIGLNTLNRNLLKQRGVVLSEHQLTDGEGALKIQVALVGADPGYPGPASFSSCDSPMTTNLSELENSTSSSNSTGDYYTTDDEE
ncbi:hypothetical protein BGZ91_002900, partial [Linnemannia elongata]